MGTAIHLDLTVSNQVSPSEPGNSPLISQDQPCPARVYTVQPGDTAGAIAAHFGMSVQELAAANHLTTAAMAQFKVGQQLQIPPPTGSRPGC